MKRIILIISAAIVLCAGAKELALPTVPANLRVPSMRADYIATHFWDSIDWSDTMAVDPMQVSQNVANYLSVFPVMSGDSARTAAADTFLTRALRAGDSRALAASQAIEDCLFGSGSPQRNEQLYTIFLQRMLAAGFPDSIRTEYMLEMTRKNMPGTQAADFEFVTRDGKAYSLLQFVDKPTIVFFYDPDCHNCHALAGAMADDPVLKSKLIGGFIKILAISPGDKEQWQEHGAWLPSQWTDGCDNGVIDEKELYSFGSYPSLYLIGKDGKVILKDCSPDELIRTTSTLR